MRNLEIPSDTSSDLLSAPVVDVSPDEAIQAILTAMRGLRDNLRELGGARLVALADEALADRLAIRLLQLHSDGEIVTLQACAFAESAMTNAAHTCALYATSSAATRGIFYVLLIMLDRLVEAYARPITGAQLMLWLMTEAEQIALIAPIAQSRKSDVTSFRRAATA